MNMFPVLSGRVVDQHAEIIVERLDQLDGLQLRVGGKYLNRHGSENLIVREMTARDGAVFNEHGMRFIDDAGRAYRPDGTNNLVGSESMMDLVKEVGGVTPGISSSLGQTKVPYKPVVQQPLSEKNFIKDDFLKIGSYYKNRAGQLIKIVGNLDSETIESYRTQLFNDGYRFQDEYRRSYLPDGSRWTGGRESKDDLIEEVEMDQTSLSPPKFSNSYLQSRVEALEECLRQTRFLVSKCSVHGFRDPASNEDLFTNNGAISKLIPVRPDDHAKSLAMVKESLKTE
jgi:hypothetical protein